MALSGKNKLKHRVNIPAWFVYGPLFLACIGSAEVPLELTETDIKVGGYVDEGRFQLKDSAATGELLGRMGAKWKIEKNFSENWTALAALHWLFWRNQATSLGLFHVAGIKFDADLEGMLSWESGNQNFQAGLYDFKYNPDSKNLGEHLLRSEAYPTILESVQGKDLMASSFSRVMGVAYGHQYELLRTKGLFYFEQFNTPVNDGSAAFFATYGPERAELGIGIAYQRFLKFGNRINDAALDSSLRAYVKDQGLESKAIKLSLRGRLELSNFLPWEEKFNLYGEVALLGLKSDTLYYKKMMERMPIMLGVDFPTYNFFTGVSVEVEYLNNPYLEKKYYRTDGTGSDYSPLPNLINYQNLPNKHSDDWRWSILLHKALSNWVDIKVRAASDHMRLLNWSGDYQTGIPMASRTKDWYFLARIEFHN